MIHFLCNVFNFVFQKEHQKMSLVYRYFMYNWGRMVNNPKEFIRSTQQDYFYKGQFLQFDPKKKMYTIQYENDTKKFKVKLDEIPKYIILKQNNIYKFEKTNCDKKVIETYEKWLKKEKPFKYTKNYDSSSKRLQRNIFVENCIAHDKIHNSNLNILFLETEFGSVVEKLKTCFDSSRIKPCNSCPIICDEIKNNHPDIEVYCGDIKTFAENKSFLAIWYDMEETWYHYTPCLDNSIFIMINLATRPYPVVKIKNKLKKEFENQGGKNIHVDTYSGKSKKKNMVWGYACF